MYLTATNCDYCQTYCSRLATEQDGVPLLHTPNIPFMAGVVCDNCLKKIGKYYHKLFSEIVKGD